MDLSGMINERFLELSDKLCVFYEKLQDGIALSDEEQKIFQSLRDEINKIDIFEIITSDKEAQ